LERRDLFSISPNNEAAFDEDAHADLLSHGGGCSCPVCAGTVANSPELWAPFQVANSPKHSLSALPQLHSLPGAQYTLFLDFNGSVTTGWASQPVTTPVYDFDGDRTTFSTAELNAIFEIWARVAEDYAPFNINVTTVDPGHLTNGQVAKVAIGGNYTDWFGSPAAWPTWAGFTMPLRTWALCFRTRWPGAFRATWPKPLRTKRATCWDCGTKARTTPTVKRRRSTTRATANGRRSWAWAIAPR
jgi:hypothetical protein